MADKSNINYSKDDLETVVNLIQQVARQNIAMLEELSKPLNALMDGSCVDGPAMEPYVEAFKSIRDTGDRAHKTCESLVAVCEDIANKMGLAMSTVTKTGEQLANDMAATAAKMKAAAQAKA